MKSLTILAFSALVALVSAIPEEPASTTTPALSPQASCAVQCDVLDICCKAGCYSVPCPDEGMANRTTECAMACPQGDGTQEETEAYASCQLSCISSYFYSGSATLPATGAGTSPASNTGTATGAPSGSGSETGSPTASETGASASSTGGAAGAHYQLGSAAAGIIGLVMAALVL